MFKFAHISDIHLAPLPAVTPHELMSKRVLGYLSWQRKRKHHHLRAVLDALQRDLEAQKPDHICVSGDLTNIGLPAEFEATRAWLQGLGPVESMSVIPGNHDAYVRESLGMMRERWKPWIGEGGFPYVHKRGPVAFVGISTAVPSAPFMACGRVGAEQLAALGPLLESLKQEGLFRVVMIHHPPQRGVSSWRKGLHDAQAFRDVIARSGAEVILHGHLHRPVFAEISGPDGKVPIYGAGSASLYHKKHFYSAHYHIFEYKDKSLHIVHRVYDADRQEFITPA